MASYYGDRSRDIPTWESFEAADNDDVVDTSEYVYASRDHILFCIDASSSMQTPRPDRSNPGGVVRGKSALHQVLDFVAKFEKSKVITGPADSVGLMLWNVDPSIAKSTSGSNYKPGTMVYQSLRTINAEEIKKIIKLMEGVEHEYAGQEEGEDTIEPPTLRKTFPACDEKEELNIADVLVTCNFLFRDAGTKLAGNKRVFLVTDNDEPSGSTSNRAPARTVYGDLLTYGITVNTFFLDKPKHRFDPRPFWNDILSREDEDGAPVDGDVDEDGLDQLSEIMNDLVIRNAPKRKQFSIPLRFGGKDGDIEIGIAGYAMISSQGKGQPKYVRMRGQTVEEVVVKSEYTSAETGATLRPEEIGTAYQFGHESTVRNVLEPNWWESDTHQAEQQELADEALRIDADRRRRAEEGEEMGEGEYRGEIKKALKGVGGGEEKPKIVARTRVLWVADSANVQLQFTPKEVEEFKSMGIAPQIKILGFQAPTNLKLDENIKHSYFIYPDEETFTGSTRTYAALLKSCLKLNRHALALCRFRSNSTPEFAVLIPQEETFTDNGGQDSPPGFHVIVLPFRDDIRQPPKAITDNLVATERQAKLMSNVVKRLRFAKGKYRSEAYPNPSLAFHYAQLQSLAFEEDFDAETATIELDKTFPKHGGMHKAAGEFMAEWNRAIEEDERCGPEAPKKGTKRGVKEEGDVDESDLPDVPGLWKAKKLSSLKVAEIREYCRYHDIGVHGKSKKADLVEVLQDYMDEHGGKVASKKSKS